ncbi:MAG: hypothetical protein PF485_04120 [Bacteroidales bacterium]|jgi:hypothetical protein|nr:hypothetical protein [Bacteroidales bacterium]
MIRKTLIYIQILGFLVLGVKNSIAQEELVKEVQVVKPYEPTISDAYKLNHLPKISDTVKVIPEIKYILQTKPLSVGYSVIPIKPAKMVGEPLTKLTNSYMKIGIGTKMLPMIEGYINNKRSKDYSIGAYYKFLNSIGNATLDNNEKEFAGFSDNDLRFFGKKYFKSSIIQGEMGLLSNTRYFYGYNTQMDTILEKDNIKQNFLSLNLDANYKSSYVDSSHINYDFGFKLDYIKDNFENNELGLNLAGDINRIFTKEMVGANIAIMHYATNENLDSVNNTIIKLNPWVGIFGDKWRIKAGIIVFSDIKGDNSKTYYYPMGLLEYDMANHYLIPYAGVDGKLEINNFQRMSAVNPFLVPGTGVLNTDHKLILFGGIRGNFNSTTYYNFKVSYTLIDNMPLFINDFENTDSIGNMFGVIYDDLELVNYFGEISVSPSEELNFNVKVNYNDYIMTTEAKAWHKPSFDLSFTTKYNLRQKIILKGDILAIGKRFAKIDNSVGFKELESAIDINIGAEYRYSKVLSGFIQLNNLLSDGYYEWNYYPTYGFNIMLGLTYSF